MEAVKRSDFDLMLGKYLILIIPDAGQVYDTKYIALQKKYMLSFLTGKYLATPGWSRLCLLLDYDGTLAPHGAHPDLTVLPPATKEVFGRGQTGPLWLYTVQVLQRLADMPEVFVSVITGRCLPDIKAKVSTGSLWRHVTCGHQDITTVSKGEHQEHHLCWEPRAGHRPP